MNVQRTLLFFCICTSASRLKVPQGQNFSFGWGLKWYSSNSGGIPGNSQPTGKWFNTRNLRMWCQERPAVSGNTKTSSAWSENKKTAKDAIKSGSATCKTNPLTVALYHWPKTCLFLIILAYYSFTTYYL